MGTSPELIPDRGANSSYESRGAHESIAAGAGIDMVRVATRSLHSIQEVAAFIGRSTAWTSDEPIQLEVTRTIKRLFDLIAWSDGKLDPGEERLYERLSKVDPELQAVLNEFDPADPYHTEFPPLLLAAIELDRRTNHHLAILLVNELETLGCAVVEASGAVLEIEVSELRAYVDNLRNLVRMMRMAH